MHIRQLAAAAALLTVSLAVTGCGPDDAAGTAKATTTQAAPPPAASTEPSAPAAGSGSSAAPAPAAGQAVSPAEEAAFEKAAMDNKGCAEYYKTHQVLVVESASAGQLKATKVKTECSQYGLRLDTSGPSATLKVASGASVVMFVKPNATKDYPRYAAQKVSFADYAKTRKPCFDNPDPDKRPAGLQCGTIFIYSTDGSGAVTSMHETWEITD